MVKLELHPDGFMVIRDNGKGFDVQSAMNLVNIMDC